jgi:hypothetical protein
LKRKSGAALEEIKTGMDAAIGEMKAAVEQAKKKFRET